jgi:exodeoxyribonuclease VII small subunit
MSDFERQNPIPSPENASSFERSLSELQSIVDRLEDGSLGLEEALSEFEAGVKLLRHCYGILERAESRIEILTSQPGAEPVETAPFDASATFGKDANSAAKPVRKRMARPRNADPDSTSQASPPPVSPADQTEPSEPPTLF